MKKTFTTEDGMSLTRETLSSQELSLSTKGVYTWTIKEYYSEGNPEEEEAAFQRIVARDIKYKRQFGVPSEKI